MPVLDKVVSNYKALILFATDHPLTRFTKASACADPALEGSIGTQNNFSKFSPVITTVLCPLLVYEQRYGTFYHPSVLLDASQGQR